MCSDLSEDDERAWEGYEVLHPITTTIFMIVNTMNHTISNNRTTTTTTTTTTTNDNNHTNDTHTHNMYDDNHTNHNTGGHPRGALRDVRPLRGTS